MENLLNNNSNEMRTVVETFIINETAELIYDGEALESWNNLVAELGLTGQTQITQKEKSPIPFMHLKQNLVAVLETLCPRKVDVEAYSVTPIPLEILRLVSLSKSEGYFDKMQIWYDDKAPDPVCIGIKGQWYSYGANNWLDKVFDVKAEAEEASKKNGKEGSYFIEKEKYLLGKWADVKRSFSELTKMATERYIQEKGHEYRNTIKDTQRKLDDLKSEAFNKFGSDVNGNDSLTIDSLNLPF